MRRNAVNAHQLDVLYDGIAARSGGSVVGEAVGGSDGGFQMMQQAKVQPMSQASLAKSTLRDDHQLSIVGDGSEC